ncbi:hypothetical protein C8F01DRAFT_1147605 [Mycena amicta]|nr:hypothetical protein C8F01DRAFT_1147605 [Mycena amicta]
MHSTPRPPKRDKKTGSTSSDSSSAGRKKSVCAECHRLKLKCDKQFPCKSCIRRGCEVLCPEGSLISAGRGKRSVRSEAPMLTECITVMGERIRLLEEAVEAHGMPRHIFRAQHAAAVAEFSVDAVADKLGALSVNADGNALYFGVTAGPEALLAMEGLSRTNPSDSHNSPDSFSSSSSSSSADSSSAPASLRSPASLISPTLHPRLQSLHDLRACFPPRLRAHTLCGLFFRHGGWTILPLTQDEVVELFAAVYADNDAPKSPISGSGNSSHGSPQNRLQLSNHRLASAFLILTLGALVDLDLPPFATEASTYFDLACKAMSTPAHAGHELVPFGCDDGVLPFLEISTEPTVELVQALTLLAIVYGHGGKQFSLDTAFALVSLADSAAKIVSFCSHRASTYAKMEPKRAYRLQALYWELYSLETVCCLSLGRPPNTLSVDITCRPPDDSAEEGQPFMRLYPGYRQGRWGYTTEVIVPILEAFIPATGKPSYPQILEIDRRIRQYIASAPFDSFPNTTAPPKDAKGNERGENVSTFMQRELIPTFCKIMLMFLHNAHFAELIQENPEDPLQSSLAPSFLAAYRGASEAIRKVSQCVSSYPDIFSRWWVLWKSLFNAAVVVGTVAATYPRLPMVSTALVDLFNGVELLEFGALSSERAQDGVKILRRLRDNAIAVRAQAPRPPSFPGVNPTAPCEHDPRAKDELEIFAGHTSFVANGGGSVQRRRSEAEGHEHEWDDEAHVDYRHLDLQMDVAPPWLQEPALLRLDHGIDVDGGGASYNVHQPQPFRYGYEEEPRYDEQPHPRDHDHPSSHWQLPTIPIRAPTPRRSASTSSLPLSSIRALFLPPQIQPTATPNFEHDALDLRAHHVDPDNHGRAHGIALPSLHPVNIQNQMDVGYSDIRSESRASSSYYR